MDTSIKRACQLLLDAEEIAELHVACIYFIHSLWSIHAMSSAAFFTVANCIVARFTTLSTIWTFIHYDVAHGYFLLVGGCFGDVVAGVEPASIGAMPIAVRAAFRYMTSIFTVAYLLARR
ncbi:hypothetical protein ACY2HL_000958 [Enterobacter roggenkampii]